MKADFAFKVSESLASVRERLEEYLVTWCGFAVAESGERRRRYVRGSRLRRAMSLRIERWPTSLDVAFFGDEEERTGIVLRYEVATGLHLVGAMEKAVLEAEAALIQGHLLTGRCQSLQAAVAGSRRPVTIAVMLNAVLATLVVAVIGIMAGYHPVAVGGVAMAVGLLDGITITAFADILVDGSRAMPRVDESRV